MKKVILKKEMFKKDLIQKKLQSIWDYEKPAIFLSLLALYMIGSMIFHFLTLTKPVCYIGFVNVTISDDTEQNLTEKFVQFLNEDPRKNTVQTYQNLYFSEDPDQSQLQYAYATQVKIMAAIEDKKLDFVFMDQTAFDILSQNEYLDDTKSFLNTNAPDLESELSNYIVNSMGLNLSFSKLISNAGFSGDVYLGIIKNSPRKEICGEYLEYIYESNAGRY